MERALMEFQRRGGEESHHQTLALGLCQAVCALLEDDREGALDALARESAHDDRNPMVYSLTGRHGLQLVLRATGGDLDLSECRAVVDGASSQLRWNRHFALLAY